MRITLFYLSALCIMISSCGNSAQKTSDDADFESMINELDSLGMQQSINELSDIPYVITEEDAIKYAQDSAFRDSIDRYTEQMVNAIIAKRKQERASEY